MSRHCYVVSCPNGDYRLKKWAGIRCNEHGGVWRGDPPCTCERPFRLFNFPVKEREKRVKWIDAIKRFNQKKPGRWLEPSRSMVVCSRHFVDGKVTAEHPLPELYLQSNTVARPPISKSKFSRKQRYADRQMKNVTVTEIVKMEEPFEQMEEQLEQMEEPLERMERIPPNKPKLIIVLGLRFIIHILMSIIRKLRKDKEELVRENLVLKTLLSEAQKKRQKYSCIHTFHYGAKQKYVKM